MNSIQKTTRRGNKKDKRENEYLPARKGGRNRGKMIIRDGLKQLCRLPCMARAILATAAATMAMFFLLADNYVGHVVTDIQSFFPGEIDIFSRQTRHAQQSAERIPRLRRYLSYVVFSHHHLPWHTG